MDTDIGNPIEYNPEIAADDEQTSTQPPQYYFPHAMMPSQPSVQKAEPKNDFLASLDKTAYLVIFAAFILGFFMGKTMQPVILRHG